MSVADLASLPDSTTTTSPLPRRLSICLINPRFEPSYWGFDFALPLYPGDKRSTMISGSLTAVAGLCGDHDVYLLDENVEEIDWESLRHYDLVGVTGMNVQKLRTRQILVKLRELGVFTVVGGPFVSVQEEFFDGLCDVKFVGEAETTWPQFLDDFARGKATEKRYEQSQPTDMLKVPRPRFDLLKVDRYASGALQYSRGCPFQCEFCDIIVIYGRRPRVKDPDQLIAELDDMRRAGFHSAFIVDDNFIGNKKKAKALLAKLIPWMEEHHYPLRLTTEASIDLAEDPELLEMMYRANFRSVFIGIETPRIDSLNETKKFQNVRGDSLASQAGADSTGGPRHQRGIHRRLRQRRPGNLRRPVSVHPGERHHAGDGRHAAGHPQDAALRSAEARRTTGRGRPQLQFRSEANDPRGAATGLLGPGPAAVHARGVSRAILQGVRIARVPPAPRGDLPARPAKESALPTLAYGLALAWFR